jgi:hypothetical protein
MCIDRSVRAAGEGMSIFPADANDKPPNTLRWQSQRGAANKRRWSCSGGLRHALYAGIKAKTIDGMPC